MSASLAGKIASGTTTLRFLLRESFECVRKAVPKMVSIVVAMLVILLIAVGTVGLVLVGIEGRGRHRAPKLAQQAARAARYVNGDASRR